MTSSPYDHVLYQRNLTRASAALSYMYTVEMNRVIETNLLIIIGPHSQQ